METSKNPVEEGFLTTFSFFCPSTLKYFLPGHFISFLRFSLNICSIYKISYTPSDCFSSFPYFRSKYLCKYRSEWFRILYYLDNKVYHRLGYKFISEVYFIILSCMDSIVPHWGRLVERIPHKKLRPSSSKRWEVISSWKMTKRKFLGGQSGWLGWA